MSLAIKRDEIRKVLLVDGWHLIKIGSFVVDSFEIVDGEELILGGGDVKEVTATGCRWIEKDKLYEDIYSDVFCPITSVLAISYSQVSLDNLIR